MKSEFRRFVPIICLFFAAMSLVSCGGAEEKRAKFFDKGKALYEKGEYTKAPLSSRTPFRSIPSLQRAIICSAWWNFRPRN